MLEYPFIDSLDFTEYKSIVLRNGGNDGTMAKMRDIICTSLVKETTDLDIAGYQTYVAYLNGEYWGTYHLREKINKYFIAQNNGLSDPDNIDLLVGTGTALVGDNSDYKKMIEFMENNSLADQDNFDYIASLMDVDNFMDYIICEIWSSNSDTGNIKYWRDKSGTTDGKWRWIYYDLDWALWPSYVDSDRVERQLDPDGHGVGSMYPTTIFRSLIKNEAWKDKFIERFAYHLENTFNSEKVVARIDEIYNSMKGEMEAEREEFGGTVANWESHVEKLREFAKNRNKYVVQHLENNLSLTTEQKQMLEDTID
ncbi:MAG: CotH kinase family protein [Eubacteriales bacterium]